MGRLLACCLAFAAAVAAADGPNQVSNEERGAGFVLLFNGQNLDGWDQKGNWTVDEGAIARKDKGGNITYKVRPVPDNFELRFQWKVAAGSNSGVYYRPGQYEYQILDNQVHRDGKNPRSSAASLYFCVAPCTDATRPVGQWNDGRIIAVGTVIQHWLNGQKVVDIDYRDPQRAAEVELLRRRGGNLADRGALLNLQDHGDPVWYRSLRWRELPADFQLDRTPIVPAVIPPEALQHEQETIQRIENARKAKAAAKPKAKPKAAPAP